MQEMYVKKAKANLTVNLLTRYQIIATTLREQLFELKNEADILKNLRIFATLVLAEVYPLTLCMSWSNLIRQSLLICG